MGRGRSGAPATNQPRVRWPAYSWDFIASLPTERIRGEVLLHALRPGPRSGDYQITRAAQ